MARGLSRLVASTACVGLLGLTACGTSEHIADGRDSTASSPPGDHPSTSTTPTTPPSTSGSPSSSPSATTSTPEDPRRVQGQVYSFILPPGWKDESDSPTADKSGADVLVSRTLPSGHRVVVTVFTTGQQVLPSQLGSEQFRKDLLNSVAGETSADVINLPDIKIDGELAVGVKTSEVASGQNISATLYMPTRFYLLYPILLVNLPEDRRAAASGFRSIIDSWSWAE